MIVDAFKNILKGRETYDRNRSWKSAWV